MPACAGLPEKDRLTPVLDHLRELRGRLIRALAGFIAASLALAPFIEPIFAYASAPLMGALPEGTRLLAVSVTAPVMAPLKVVLFCAFCLSLPFTAYQFWAFAAPGLYKREKRLVIPLLLSTMAMFAAGVAYCFFIVFGFLFRFIARLSPDAVSFAPDIDAYIGFVLHMFLAFGIAFEIPIAEILLITLKAVSLKTARRLRRYVIVLAFLLAAVITPPDIASQFLLAVPIIVLYELGLAVSALLLRRAPSRAAA